MRHGFLILAGLLLLLKTANAQVESNFSVDADGWTAADNGNTANQTIVHDPGGFITMTTANPQPMYWYAPSKFMGNRAYTSYGETFSFDVQTAATTPGHSVNGDIAFSDGSTTMYLNASALPVGPGVWTTMTVTLHESANWKINDISGPTASRAQIVDILTNLSTIKIYVAWKNFPTANTLGALDNVKLNVHPPRPLPPVVTSLSTTKAAQGSNITITGTNFGTNNAVYFGDTRAHLVSSTPTSIVVTVPVGADYGPVTVINLITSLSATSQRNFTPTFASGGGARIIKSSFTPDVLFNKTVGWLGHGDINGDGRPEMLASQGNVFSIFENISTPGEITTSSFDTRIDMSPSLPSNYVTIDMSDLDGDGKQDLFLALRDNPDRGRVLVMRNIHTSGPVTSGSFATFQEFDIPPGTGSAATAADLDGDGRPELVAWGSSCGANPIYILQNISNVGDINFAAAISIPGSSGCSGRYVLVDLDVDGKIDIVEATDSRIRIVRNISVPGTLQFEPGVELNEGATTVSVGDIDNDGRQDIVFSSGGMKIYKNVSTPGTLGVASFAGPVTFAGGVGTAKIADMNGDGKPDVITGTSSGVGVFENITPDGQINTSSFKPVVAVKTGAGATEIEVFDVDVDGRTDIMSNNGGFGNISVNQNIVRIPPVITNINPKSASPGSTITITGTNFGSVASDHVVYFGVAAGTVTSASPTSLEVTVPKGASYDQVSVAVKGFTVFSQQFFSPTFGGGTFDASSFAAAFNLTITNATDGLSSVDYDVDGKVDIIADNSTGFSVFRNTGADNVVDATTFATPYSIGFEGRNHISGDFDGDGKQDISSQSYLFRNTTDAVLPDPILFQAQVTRSNGPGAVHSGPSRDLNNDGKVDVFYTSNAPAIYFEENLTSSGAFTTYGLATSSFATSLGITKPSNLGYCVAADFDGDGFNDIAATNPDNDNFHIFLNAGIAETLSTGSFVAKGPFGTGDMPQGIVAFDYDRDGKIDLAIANAVNSSSANILIFRNTSTPGNLSFVQQGFPAAPGATDLVAADLDGDSRPDLAVINANPNSFSVFKNTSTVGVLNTGSFAARVDYATGTLPTGISVADIDRDLRPDIIVRTTGIISIFKNLMPLGPVISIEDQPDNVAACENASTSFSVLAMGADNLSYQWQKLDPLTGTFEDLAGPTEYNGVDTQTLIAYNLAQSMTGGIYRVVVTGDGASPVTSDPVTLTVTPSPSAPTTSNATACKGQSVTLEAEGSVDGYYRWYDAATSPHPINGETNSSFQTPVIFGTTAFYAAIADANGCISSKTLATATIQPLDKPVIDADGTLLCGTNTVELTAPGGFAQYHWSNGESGQEIEVSITGSYSLIVEDVNGCTSLASDPVFITTGSIAKPTIVGDKTHLCVTGDQAVLAAEEGFDSYEWSTGETTQTITVALAGDYSVRVTNSSGCESEASDVFHLGAGAQKPEISVGPDVLVSSAAKTYQWYFGDLMIPEGTEQFLKYNPFQYGAYSVSITDFSDCTSTSDVFVNLVTATEEPGLNEFVYPSPFEDVLVVTDEAKLLDATGKTVKHLAKGENDVSQLSRGLYFVTIKKEGELKTIKVSK